MILFNNVVAIRDFADFDGGAVLRIVARESRFIGRAPVDGDFLRHAMAAHGPGQASRGRLLVALLREEAIDGLTRLIHGERESHSPLTLMDVSSMR